MADSAGNIARIEGFRTLIAIHGRTLRRDNGDTVQALISDADMINLESVVGGDPREKMNVDIIKPIPEFKSQEVLLLVEEQVRIQFLTRKDNPVDPIARFGARKMTDEDA